MFIQLLKFNFFLIYLEIIENTNLKIDKLIDFAKEDIEVRIESMKAELDNLCKGLIKELANCKNELTR